MLMQFLFFVFFGGEGKVNKVYYGLCESGESPTQKKKAFVLTSSLILLSCS